jgi:hypothetical protein
MNVSFTRNAGGSSKDGYASYTVLTWWLDGGAKLPPKRVDAMFRRFATEGITPSYS